MKKPDRIPRLSFVMKERRSSKRMTLTLKLVSCPYLWARALMKPRPIHTDQAQDQAQLKLITKKMPKPPQYLRMRKLGSPRKTIQELHTSMRSNRHFKQLHQTRCRQGMNSSRLQKQLPHLQRKTTRRLLSKLRRKRKQGL